MGVFIFSNLYSFRGRVVATSFFITTMQHTKISINYWAKILRQFLVQNQKSDAIAVSFIIEYYGKGAAESHYNSIKHNLSAT